MYEAVQKYFLSSIKPHQKKRNTKNKQHLEDSSKSHFPKNTKKIHKEDMKITYATWKYVCKNATSAQKKSKTTPWNIRPCQNR